MPLIRGVVASGFSGPSQTPRAPYLMVVMPPGQQRAGHTDAVMKLLWTAGWSQNQFQSSKGSEYLHLPSKHKYPRSPPFQIRHFHWLLGFPHLKRNPAFLFPFLWAANDREYPVPKRKFPSDSRASFFTHLALSSPLPPPSQPPPCPSCSSEDWGLCRSGL